MVHYITLHEKRGGVLQNRRAYIAGLLIVLIWSGWIIISRFGVQNQLTPADITMLRYVTALLVVSPLFYSHLWKKYSISQYLVVGLGVGFPYTMTSFYGLTAIKAAHAGVLINGMLPIFGAIAAFIFFGERVSLKRYVAIVIMCLANFLMMGENVMSFEHLAGIFLLLGAAASYTVHMIAVRKWGFNWKDVLVAVPLVNTILFLPVWFLLPSNVFKASFDEIVLQAVYQGIIVNVIALSCIAYAIRQLGTITVSLFMSFVPVTTAILAWLVLGERLSQLEIAGIAGCTAGLIVYSRG